MKLSKLLALVLALAMVFSLAACGGKTAEPAKTDTGKTDAPAAKTYTIGINTWGSGVPVLDMFGDAVEYTITTMGHKVNRMSDDFNADKEPNAFILSLKAGGFGLNLTRATHVIHFDRWWNPAVENQATDRAHRIGQTRTVFVHTLICEGTLESRIDDLITGKTELARQIVGSGDSWLAGLSDDKLREILALSSSATDYAEETE